MAVNTNKKLTSKAFNDVMAQYREKYDVESLENPNDLANLETMIRNQLLIEQLQDRLDDLITGESIDSVEVKKILDSIVALSQTNVQYERTLGIDRKTRKQQQAESVVDYIVKIKQLAREFLDNDRRIIKVMCKTCNIMVGRVSGVYETTEFGAAFQCPQCKKHITVNRKERDVFFDVKNADWRRKYTMEVIQPKRTRNAPDVMGDDELTIGDVDLGLEYDD
jgi:hypothetical protein